MRDTCRPERIVPFLGKKTLPAGKLYGDLALDQHTQRRGFLAHAPELLLCSCVVRTPLDLNGIARAKIMWDLQKAADEPPMVTCAIGKCISTAYRRKTFLRTLRILSHGGDDLLVTFALIDSCDRRTREQRCSLVQHRRWSQWLHALPLLLWRLQLPAGMSAPSIPDPR